MDIHIGFITETSMNDKEFNCPNCKTKNPFAIKHPAIKGSMSYEGLKSVCFFCDTPFVGLKESCIPSNLLKHFKTNDAYNIEFNLYEMETEILEKVNQFERF